MSPVSPPNGYSSELHHDRPIDSEDEDRFGWKDLAERLGDALTLTPADPSKAPGNDPIVIGLYGAWGSGKSSLMNIVAAKLKARPPKELSTPGVRERADTDPVRRGILGGGASVRPSLVTPGVPSCVIVRFNPWYFKGEEALIQAFFQEMSTAIGASTIPRRAEIVRAIKMYTEWLVPLGATAATVAAASIGGPSVTALATSIGAILKSIYEFFLGTKNAIGDEAPSLSEQRKLLSAALNDSKVRIIVLIDDIDRLYADDVLTMMKLVRLVGDLPYVSYLLAFDREVVEGCLAMAGPQANTGDSGKEYLAKIVQLSVQVPTPRADKLCEYAIDELATVLREHYSADETERLALRLYGDWSSVFGYRLSNLRQVKRIVNAARVALPLFRGSVDPVDGILLETLRVYSPEVHRLLTEKPEYLYEDFYVSTIAGRRIDTFPSGRIFEILKSEENLLSVLGDLLRVITATIINIDALLRRHSHSRAPRRGRASA